MFKRLATIGLTLLATVFIAAPVFAAPQVDILNDVCDGTPNATACQEKKGVTKDTSTTSDDQNPIFGPSGVLTKIINILSIVVGITAVIGIMAAGLRFITSGSNPQQVTVAREMVLYASVGLIVAGLAQILVRFMLSKL